MLFWDARQSFHLHFRVLNEKDAGNNSTSSRFISFTAEKKYGFGQPMLPPLRTLLIKKTQTFYFKMGYKSIGKSTLLIIAFLFLYLYAEKKLKEGQLLLVPNHPQHLQYTILE